MPMKAEIIERLSYKSLKNISKNITGGCINTGTAYRADNGDEIFVKYNSSPDSPIMFEGEIASLNAIRETKAIRAPKPILLIDLVHRNQGASLVMEFFQNLKSLEKHQGLCGEKLGNLHLDNIILEKREKKLENWIGKPEPERNFVKEFGFHTVTCCGRIPLVNDWHEDWVSFYARNRLDPQIRQVQEEVGDRKVGELWSALQLKIPNFFTSIEGEIKPSLLHGDLWSGNAGELEDEPVVFDPGSFYGHHEFDLSISNMFGGFTKEFYTSYHNVIKKDTGFSQRQDLYMLFHNLNHWNHFGFEYADSSIRLMEKLLNY
ncbi:ketosamine-3-kinase-like [Brevipalpus obovatus]|uniref:ketosamine-3-kinase-like n=1 Tax=Brevipalpus obovatus TaxID=246614 RepID=UPI003D9F4944